MPPAAAACRKGLPLFPSCAKNGTLGPARGHEHAVSAVSVQDGLCTLHLPQGEAAYFERLFRDVRVDATLFTLVEDAPCP